MKLFHVFDNEWAAKIHLIDDMDLDLAIAFYSNKTIVTINITDHRCPEGMILSRQLDGEFVQLLVHDAVLLSGPIQHGQFKRQTKVLGVPNELRLEDLKLAIPISYE